ncbi:high affinity sulfate transporter 1 [Methanomicrobium sp. W14]|uniref:SulP family inorganic anion transporter n=1 Tax=Methanomicrobium sp. W14 TaxID=2817839 RepID=UPI001AE95853|nr:SulP family inorganic anion transporter [Methanomicrobium sp. W14]MBP2133240.1 high affinity sulfate transporter 1 [Methanomicrobium sp. W14]
MAGFKNFVNKIKNYPYLSALLPLKKSQVPVEIIAGITFASLAIPEVMGYTSIAGMPVVTGLYTMLLPMLVFAFLGSSRHLVVGADSATAAIIAGGLIVYAVPKSSEYVAYAGVVAIISAVLLITAGILKLGFIADFLSKTVLIGFLTGIGIQISLGQIGVMLGGSSTSDGSIYSLESIFNSLLSINIPTLILSLCVVAFIVSAGYFDSRIPGALIAVVLTTFAGWITSPEVYGIKLLGEFQGGLPQISLPVIPYENLLGVVEISVACFLVILAQSAATSRAYALKYSEKYDENTDLLALGFSNAAAGISGTFVVNGSPTKTEMVDSAGGRTQLSQLVAVCVVAAVLVFITKPLSYLPQAVLASVVFVIGLKLIDIKGMITVFHLRPVEFIVALIAAVSVVLFGVGEGLGIAVAFSIVAHLRHSYRPLNSLLVTTPRGAWRPTSLSEGLQAEEGLLIYRFGSNLYFANESMFTREVVTLAITARPHLKWFCLSAANIGDVDYTSSEALKEVYYELEKRGITFVICDIVGPVFNKMEKDGFFDLIGRENIFANATDVLYAYRNLDKQVKSPDI